MIFPSNLRSILLTAVSLLLICSAFGQSRKKFTETPITFIEELSDFMSASKKKEGKALVEEDFGELFQAQYSVQQQLQIMVLANLMLDKKMRAYPDFEFLINGLIAYPTAGLEDQKFKEWFKFITDVIENKKMKKYYSDIMESSATLFIEGAFFTNSAVKWKASEPNYEFIIDSLPLINFPSLDLTCYSKGDSSMIYGTKGVYFPTLKRWKGDGGKVTWERADLSADSTYANLPKYEIRLKSPSFIIDSVVFHTSFFEQPLMGELTEKVLADKRGDNASFPKFESYDKRLRIRNIEPGIDYEGGFTMAGAKLAGSGTNEEPALLTFYREDRPFLIASSLEFIIRDDRFASTHSSVTIKLEDDSIFHPDLNFKFSKNNRQLILLRSDEGISKSPYYNTYHKVDMVFEAFYWNIDDPLIRMGALTGSSDRSANFESSNYFRKRRYEAMIPLGTTSPLIHIYDYMNEYNTKKFWMEDLARYMRLSETQVNFMLIDLGIQGFVNYDIETTACEVNEKLEHYVWSSAGRIDYDVLQFNSAVGGGTNAQLNLLNYDLKLEGIDRIQLSDSQEVVIYPSNREVVLKQNRDFNFGGRIKAGKFEFIGKEYEFTYDNFQVELVQVDSCRIYVEDYSATPDRDGKYPLSRVKNVLENMKGTLKIDAPTNKSGTQSQVYKEYPILDSKKETYVYYDDRHIQDGAYDRDRFYYKVEPFRIDSLDNFSQDDLEFEGVFVSGGIFPDITEPLALQEDLSLGFIKKTPSNGLPLYGGKANFTDDVVLNYNGLQGTGKLEYLSSTAESEQFVFFPDSTKGKTYSYNNLEKSSPREVPKVRCAEVDLAYFPVQDRLTASSREEDLEFFNDEARLEGQLELTPAGMTGQGEMSFSGAFLKSNKFDYKRRKIQADTSDFKLAQEDVKNLAFITNNVNSEIDFDERIGVFKSNDDETKVEFPANQYICFMDQFKWFMDQDKMEMSSSRKVTDDFVIDTSEKQSRSNFFSVNELQDSLNFLAPKAVYDIAQSKITASKIQYIAVADAKITPDSGYVVIDKRAKMEPLLNASVLANTVTQYHNLFNCNLEIRGRLEYLGDGYYNYEDANKMKQMVYFEEVWVDSTKQTIAAGRISDDDEFMLSPQFGYYGGIDLVASREHIEFDGGVQIVHTCEKLERNHLEFKAVIDPNDIYIPVDTAMRDLRAAKLGAGVIISDDPPIELYSAFLSEKQSRKDQGLISAYGYLHYDQGSKMYKIGSKEKIQQESLPGNMIALNTTSCEIIGYGAVDLHVALAAVKVKPYGIVTHNDITQRTEIDGIATVTFPFDDGGWKHITDRVLAWPDLKPVDISKTKYEQGLKEVLGLEAAEKLITEITLSGQMKKVPDALLHSFTLADVKLVWNESDESYISEGPIGIANMGKKQIFRYVNGKVEVVKSRSYDIFRFYFELDPVNWFFFEYKNGIMTVSSSDKDWLSQLAELKEDKRKFKDDEGNKFSFNTSVSRKLKDRFITRFPEFQ